MNKINLSITITPVDISLGEQGNCRNCPTTRAVARAWQAGGHPTIDTLRTENSYTILRCGRERYRAIHPEPLRNWISRFDSQVKNAAQPFATTLVFEGMVLEG